MPKALLTFEMARYLGSRGVRLLSCECFDLKIVSVIPAGEALMSGFRSVSTLVVANLGSTVLLYDANTMRVWSVPIGVQTVMQLTKDYDLSEIPYAIAVCRALCKLGVIAPC